MPLPFYIKIVDNNSQNKLPPEKNLVALHEAGHAWASEKWGNGYQSISIKSDGIHAGTTFVNPQNIKNKSDCIKALNIIISGTIAEHIYSNSPVIPLTGPDYKEAKFITSYILNTDDEKEINEYLLKRMKAVKKIIFTSKVMVEIFKIANKAPKINNFSTDYQMVKAIKETPVDQIDPRLKEIANKVDHSLDNVIPFDKLEKMSKDKEES